MTTVEPTVMKWLDSSRKPIKVGDEYLWTIPDEEFSLEEIEVLREHDALEQSLGYGPLIANFLPDGVRPEGVKKL